MTVQPEHEYYLARVAAEQAAAERAENERPRTIHLQLAEHYQRIVEGKQQPPTPK